MSEELKPCPFCGCCDTRETKPDDPYTWCLNPVCGMYDIEVHIDTWASRLIEDALREEINQLKTQLAGRTYCHSDEKVNNELEAVTRERDDLINDAKKWRSLLGCQRIRVLGSAGVGRNYKGDGYCHIGLEVWSKYGDVVDDAQAREHFREFMETLQALESEES